MADPNATPATPAPQPKPGKTAEPEYDAGHIPMTEEFDSAKRSLPPAAPVAIALVIVAIVVALIAFVFRAKPVAQGGIEEVFASEQSAYPGVMVAIQLTLRNVEQKPIYIKGITAELKTDEGTFNDEAASPSDYERYFGAYPDLKVHATEPLKVETKIPPGGEQKGTVLVSFQVTKQQFDARKDLTVTVQPYDQRPIVFHERGTQEK